MPGRRAPLATPAEVAAYLRVSERTLEDWAYRERGPHSPTSGSSAVTSGKTSSAT